jgi:hypothetical protein
MNKNKTVMPLCLSTHAKTFQIYVGHALSNLTLATYHRSLDDVEISFRHYFASTGGSSERGPDVADMPSTAGAAGAAVSVGAGAAGVSVVFTASAGVSVGAGVGSGALGAVVSVGADSAGGAPVAAVSLISQDISWTQSICLKTTRDKG